MKPVLEGFVPLLLEVLVVEAGVLLQPLPQVYLPYLIRKCWLPSNIHFPGTGSQCLPPAGETVAIMAAAGTTSTLLTINTGMEAVLE